MEKYFGKTPDVPFGDALKRYAKAQRRDHYASFAKSTKYRLRYLQEWFGEFNIADITLVDIEDFMDERLDYGVSHGTIQKDVSTLRALLNKAHREELLDRMPRIPKLQKYKPRTRWINQTEEEALVANAAPHLIPLIRLAVNTGGRRGELLSLKWQNVDFANRQIIFVETKNGDDRPIKLCERAYKTLLNLEPKDFGSVFTYKGKAIKSVKTSFDKARSKAGLSDVRFHDLRHTFASRLVQGGLPLYDLMHLMGHKSLDMVQRYAHLAPDYQKDAMRVLDQFGHTLVTVDKTKSAAA